MAQLIRRRLWPLLLFVLTALALAPEAQATHLLGGDLTYVYLGNNGPAARPYRYRVTLKAYVDGTPPSNFFNGFLGNNATLFVYSATTNTQIISPISIPSDEQSGAVPVRQVIPVANGCSISIADTAIRIFLNTFTTEIELPFSLKGYRLQYSSSARSGQIQNLALTQGGQGPTNGNTFTAFIPSPLLPNSSPQFFDNATTFICRSDTVTLANSARDPDGDRLIYSFVKPLDAVNNGTIYSAPPSISYDSSRGYTQAQPFGPGGIAEINSASGFTRYHSPAVGAFVIAFEVREYRTLSSGIDSLLSTTRREVQILVRDCLPNNPPVTNNGSPSLPPITDYTITEGESLTFDVGATDRDTTGSTLDTLTISGSADIIDGTGGYTGPLATFPTVTGVNHVKTTFTFQSQCGIHGTYPVNVRVVDKGCPPKTTNAVYLVTVQPFRAPKTLSTGEDSVCGSGDTYTYTINSTAPSNQFKWAITGGTIVGTNIGKTITVKFNNPAVITAGNLRLVQTSGVGCKDSTDFPVRIFPLFPVAITPLHRANLCQGDTLPLHVRGGFGNYHWTDISGGVAIGLSNVNDSSTKAFPDTSRTYVVTSTNVAGCPVHDTIAVRFVRDVARAGRDSSFCSGFSTIIGSDSVAGYNYSWTPAAGVVLPTRSFTSVRPLNHGQADTVYTFVQTATERASGCISTDTVKILVLPLPIANAGPDTATFCSGSTIDLPGSSSFTSSYVWTVISGNIILVQGTDSTDTLSVKGYTPDHFTVSRSLVRLRATNISTGCVGYDSINIRVNPLPLVSFSPRDSACAGTAITLGDSAFSGYVYDWQVTGGLTLSDTGSAQPVITYPVAFGDTASHFTASVHIVNQYGCAYDSSQQIRRNNLPLARAGADRAFCSGDTVQVGQANNPMYQYAWQNAPGFSMLNIAQPTFTATNTPAGSADRIDLLGLEVTNTRTTCQASDSIRLTVHSRPAVLAALTDTVSVCNKDSVQLGSPARSNQTYAWGRIPSGAGAPPVFLRGASTAQPEFVSQGGWANNQSHAFVVAYTVRAANDTTGCAARDTVQVKINPTPALYPVVSGDPYPYVDSSCSGSTGTVAHLSTLYSATLRPQWAITEGLTLADTNSFNPTYTLSLPNPGDPSRAVRYPVRVAYSATGCADTASVKVIVLPIPVAQVRPDLAVCSLQPITIGLPGQPGRRYVFAPGLGLSDTGTAQPVFTLDNPTQHDSLLTVTVRIVDITNRYSCSNRDTLALTVHPLPIANAGPDSAAVCSGSPIRIGGDSASIYTYRWTPAAGLNSDTIAEPLLVQMGANINHTEFRVLVTNRVTGCQKADSINVRLNPLPLVVLGSTRQVCAGQPASLGAGNPDSAAFTYQWSPATGLSATTTPRTTFVSNTAGNYVIRLSVQETATACRNSDSLTLTVNSLPVASPGNDTSYCADGQVTIGRVNNPGESYVWSVSPPATLTSPNAATTGFSEPNLTLAPITATVYLDVTIGATNCKSRDSILVTTNPRPLNAGIIPAPNVICPGTQNQPYNIDTVHAGYTYTWTVGDSATIASGQGTGQLLVNFAGPINGGTITTIATNTYGCTQRGPSSTTYTVNPILHPASPLAASGLSALCFNQGRDSYSTVTSPNSTYTWRYEYVGQTSNVVAGNGQTVSVQWPSIGLAKIWVDEISQPPNAAQCLGSSDTLLVRINRSPDTTLAISGATSLCQGANASFSLAGLDSSTYRWMIMGMGADTVAFTGQPDSLINATFDTAGAFMVHAFETTNHGCPGTVRDLSLIVNPTPVPAFATGTYVCPQQTQVTFGVTNPQPTDQYAWMVDQPAEITSGQGTPNITIKPNGAPISGLTVVETGAGNCPSSLTTVPFNSDNSAIELLSVSTKEDDDSKVIIRLRTTNNESQTALNMVERADNLGGFTPIGNVDIDHAGNILTYEDTQPASTSESVNRYRVSLENRCAIAVQSAEHSTMWLTASGNDNKSTANLSWTPYVGFTGLQQYEILTEVDGEAVFSPLKQGSIVSVPADPAAVVKASPVVGQDGFKQAYRIKATNPANNEVSFSNIAHLTFENALVFWNIVTANGDGIQDDLMFKNLGLYPENHLRVYNRWGRMEYEASNYQGGYAPSLGGTYMYEFTTPAGVQQKGWFEVVK